MGVIMLILPDLFFLTLMNYPWVSKDGKIITSHGTTGKSKKLGKTLQLVTYGISTTLEIETYFFL